MSSADQPPAPYSQTVAGGGLAILADSADQTIKEWPDLELPLAGDKYVYSELQFSAAAWRDPPPALQAAGCYTTTNTAPNNPTPLMIPLTLQPLTQHH